MDSNYWPKSAECNCGKSRAVGGSSSIVHVADDVGITGTITGTNSEASPVIEDGTASLLSNIDPISAAKIECALARERQALEQIALIRSSVSWRLTAPLRAMKRFWPF